MALLATAHGMINQALHHILFKSDQSCLELACRMARVTSSLPAWLQRERQRMLLWLESLP